VSRYVLRGDGRGIALLSSASARTERAQVRVAGSGSASILAYDGEGILVSSESTSARTVSVAVPAEGFVVVRR
jgi:hypothetical protein